MNATKKLDGLRRKLAEAKSKEREIATMPNQLRDEVARLAEALAEHDLPIDGSPPSGGAARKAWDALAAARAKLDGPWAARMDRARVEREQIEAEIARYSQENLGELVGEAEPAAYAARDAVVAALADVAAKIDDYDDVGQRLTTVLGPVPGIDGRDIPSPPFDSIRKELRRLRATEIPAPLPRSLYGVEAADEEEAAHARAVEATVGEL